MRSWNKGDLPERSARDRKTSIFRSFSFFVDIDNESRADQENKGESDVLKHFRISVYKILRLAFIVMAKINRERAKRTGKNEQSEREH